MIQQPGALAGGLIQPGALAGGLIQPGALAGGLIGLIWCWASENVDEDHRGEKPLSFEFMAISPSPRLPPRNSRP